MISCFCMFVKKLSPMEKTRLFFVNHLHHRISPINNVNNIIICLGIICHEPFENGHIQPFIFNNCIHLPPDNTLCFSVLKLHVIDCNCHDLIDRVINVTNHSRPSLNTLYVIKHHRNILQIITKLHSLNQIESKGNSIGGHFEQINFLPGLLTKKTTALKIGITR
jgi:hypothetical protein